MPNGFFLHRYWYNGRPFYQEMPMRLYEKAEWLGLRIWFAPIEDEL